MRKLLFIAALLFAAACKDEDDCYKCNIISADGRFSTTTYLKCNVDIEEYEMYMLESGKAGSVECFLMD